MKNLKIKLFLQAYILPVISKINENISHNPYRILFYINSDFRDNNLALYNYMVRNGYNKKYEIIVACRDYKKYKSEPLQNVHFIGTLNATIHFFSAKWVFYSVGRIPIRPGKDQVITQMWHGMPLKKPDEGLRKVSAQKVQYYTWLLSTSHHLSPVIGSFLGVPSEHIYVGGQPRCDVLFENRKYYDLGSCKKVILWTPTFRKSYIRDYTDVDMGDNIIPILSDSNYQEFDDYLKSMGVKVVVKLHPAQDLSKYHALDTDNLIIYDHESFMKRKYDLYTLAAQSDALITDYSSIFFDYLLLNRPIGFTEDDIEEYGNNRGFMFDTPEDYKPGMKICNYEDLCNFIHSVAYDNDTYFEERKRVNQLVNDFREGGYCKRLLEFLEIR